MYGKIINVFTVDNRRQTKCMCVFVFVFGFGFVHNFLLFFFQNVEVVI